MKKTILITACGGHYIADVVDCYRKIDGVETTLIGVASDLDDSVVSHLDKYIEVPRVTEEGYYDILLDLCQKHNVDILIPSMDEELVPLRNMKEKFEAIGTMISVSDCPGLDIATDKLRFLDFLKENKLPYPDYHPFVTPEELIEAAHKLGWPDDPICIKATNKAGSRSFRIIDASKDLLRSMLEEKPSSRYAAMSTICTMYLLSELRPQMIAQEFLTGAEYSVDLLADHGKVLYMVGRVNSVVDNSIPLRSTLRKNTKAYDICRKVVELLELDGNIGLDFIFNYAGNPIPLEVNARITATISLCERGGVNLAGLQVMKMLGMDLPKVKPVYGTNVVKQYKSTYYMPDDEGVDFSE